MGEVKPRIWLQNSPAFNYCPGLPHPRQIRPVHRAVEGRDRRLPGEVDAAQGLGNGREIPGRGAYIRT